MRQICVGKHFDVFRQVFWSDVIFYRGGARLRPFPKNPRYSALAIAILFGSGGGLIIFLAGASLPLMIDIFETSEWPFAWTLIGAASLCFLPISLWSAKQLSVSSQNNKNSISPPVLRLLPEIIGYACFGFGYIVYLTFLSAWMIQTKADASFITLCG